MRSTGTISIRLPVEVIAAIRSYAGETSSGEWVRDQILRIVHKLDLGEKEGSQIQTSVVHIGEMGVKEQVLKLGPDVHKLENGGNSEPQLQGDGKQLVHKPDLTSIPGVYRGMPPRNPFPLTAAQERAIAEHVDKGILEAMKPPEPEIISDVVRYERGKRYPKGTKVAIWNPRTKQTEIREAPETDAEGNEI